MVSTGLAASRPRTMNRGDVMRGHILALGLAVSTVLVTRAAFAKESVQMAQGCYVVEGTPTWAYGILYNASTTDWLRVDCPVSYSTLTNLTSLTWGVRVKDQSGPNYV